jgi:hypothetical protein
MIGALAACPQRFATQSVQVGIDNLTSQATFAGKLPALRKDL